MTITEILQTLEAAAPWILAILVATTTLAHALARAARAFERWAATTPSPHDDLVARRAVRWADGAAAALDWISALLPRVGLGRVPTEAPPREQARRPPTGRGGGALVLLLALASTATVHLTGCGAAALGVQADMVAVGGILAAEADAALVRARTADLDEVVTEAQAECGAGDCSDERRDHWRGELEEREARWAPAMACREQVPEALRGWGEALDTARVAQTSSIGAELLARHGGRFVLVYAAFRRCVVAAAPERVDLPDPPPELLGYAEAFTQRSPAATAGGEAGAR